MDPPGTDDGTGLSVPSEGVLRVVVLKRGPAGGEDGLPADVRVLLGVRGPRGEDEAALGDEEGADGDGEEESRAENGKPSVV